MDYVYALAGVLILFHVLLIFSGFLLKVCVYTLHALCVCLVRTHAT